MAKRNRPLALRRPYPSHDRLQADSMLVHRPDFDDSIGMLLFFLSGSVVQFFFRRDPPRSRLWDGVAAASESNSSYARLMVLGTAANVAKRG
jgi:hypothetical protein